jgi:hypothetical protein
LKKWRPFAFGSSSTKKGTTCFTSHRFFLDVDEAGDVLALDRGFRRLDAVQADRRGELCLCGSRRRKRSTEPIGLFAVPLQELDHQARSLVEFFVQREVSGVEKWTSASGMSRLHASAPGAMNEGS